MFPGGPWDPCASTFLFMSCPPSSILIEDSYQVPPCNIPRHPQWIILKERHGDRTVKGNDESLSWMTEPGFFIIAIMTITLTVKRRPSTGGGEHLQV